MRDRPDDPVRFSGGGSHGSAHSWPSSERVECTGCSQNWAAMLALTSCRLRRDSGMMGMAAVRRRPPWVLRERRCQAERA